MIVSTVVHQPTEHVTDQLDDIGDAGNDSHDDDHDIDLVALIAVLDGEVIHVAAAHGVGHDGITQEGDDSDGGRLNEDR